MKELFDEIVIETEDISSVHRNFLQQQRRVHDRFLSLQNNLMAHIKNLPTQLSGFSGSDEPLVENGYFEFQSEIESAPPPAFIPPPIETKALQSESMERMLPCFHFVKPWSRWVAE